MEDGETFEQAAERELLEDSTLVGRHDFEALCLQPEHLRTDPARLLDL